MAHEAEGAALDELPVGHRAREGRELATQPDDPPGDEHRATRDEREAGNGADGAREAGPGRACEARRDDRDEQDGLHSDPALAATTEVGDADARRAVRSGGHRSAPPFESTPAMIARPQATRNSANTGM